MREFNAWTWIIRPCDSHHSVFTFSFQDVGQGQLLFYCQPRTELITEETHVSTASVMKFYFYSVLFHCFLLESHYAKENIYLVHQHKDDKTLRIFILSRCHLNFYKCDQKLFLPAQGNTFFGKIFSAESFCLHEKYCAEVLSQGTKMMQLPMPAPLRNLRREWTNMSVFVLDGELWDSQKSGAVLHKCFSHSPFPASDELSLAYSSSALALAQLPGQNTEVWGTLCLSQSAPSQKLSVSTPTCPTCSDTDNPCRSTLVIAALRLGALLDSGPLVPDILTHIIPTSPVH